MVAVRLALRNLMAVRRSIVGDPVDTVRKTYSGLWGDPARKAEFRKGELLVEVEKREPEANPEGVALYATLGGSRHPVPGRDSSHRFEFILGLLPERDDVASALAALALYSAREAEPLNHGHTVPADGPLWPGTEMDGFLVVRPISELVPIIEADGLHIEILQAIPIFPSERSALRHQSAEEMLGGWQERGVAFWDPERQPQA